ncbi:MAG TPA: right-handed parallel beta-helix repeat-containing protein [Clostridiales bacterium]|nr:MAG: hypothetical protein BWY37_01736 [Firmicutes bacterium ADurb.Bin262]HOU10309.1 right-handed parallel beta-helix repeat-containing protein [Clostridiales bacterium]HQH63258.1 right-handed parallel beta-helix repeat-containing protein [Clostridiales bacterium]HQK74315.1 right-handed parallel beta-helix repeat-containing protein [Clostridiales bacterium]
MRKIERIWSVCMAAVLLFGVCAPYGSAAGAGQTYYVDAAAGSDLNGGRSPADAWATLAKVGETAFLPGDVVLLKRGGVYTGSVSLGGSGTAENPITLGAYGSGAAPLLTVGSDQTVLTLLDQSHWIIRDLEITAPAGNAILVRFRNKTVENILIENVVMHDVKNRPSPTYYSGSNAALRIMGSAAVYGAHIENVTVRNCEIYDAGYGVFTGGNYPNRPAAPYNRNIVVEGCSLHDIYDDAFIMADTDTIILRDSSVIKTCQSDGLYPTAPVWMWGVNRGLVERCEFAGSKNKRDGMTVDFDAHTMNSVYQYVYSHDNVRFMTNCPAGDDYRRANTVRYCLSVNDNVLDSGGAFYQSPETDLLFYNNTLVNCGDLRFKNYDRATIMNNIFYMKTACSVSFSPERSYRLGNNCYYNTYTPMFDLASLNRNPGFAGSDFSDKNSFALRLDSPCNRAGATLGNMGNVDFFGNPTGRVHSVGCFDADIGEPLPPGPPQTSGWPALAALLARLVTLVRSLSE